MKPTDAIPIIHLDTIDTYHKLYGIETLHPLVSVIDFKNVKEGPNHARFLYGFYALWLKHGTQCAIRYGRQRYDYQDGTIVSFAPGQVVEVELENGIIDADVTGLLFHPDLFVLNSLGRNLGDYHFFDYDSAESLHLSAREQKLFVDTLHSIRYELEQPVDAHSQTILIDRIRLILDYCRRFYDRQFYTRHGANSDVLVSFEQAIRDYFQHGEAAKQGIPTVNYFADKACLSPGYFGDLIKKETGMMARQFIQQKMVEISKMMVLDERYTFTQVAEFLGFRYPQHFTRFFKRQIGVTPAEYRGR